MNAFAPLVPANISTIRELSQARCGFITDIAWSPDGFTMAVAHGGGIWLYEGGFSATPSLTLSDHEGPVKSLAFNPTGLVLISASTDTTVRMWIPNRGRAFYVYRGHSGAVNAVTISPNGRVLASAGGDRDIRLFDMMESAASNVLRGHTHEITGLGFGLGGRVLVSGSWDKTVRVWAFEPDRREQVHVFEHPDWVRTLTVSPDGKRLVTACKDAKVRLFDLETRDLLVTFTAHESGVDDLAFNPSGTLLATGGHDGVIKFWDVEALIAAEPNPIHQLDAHTKPIRSIVFHPAGTLFASGSGDNTIRLWGIRL